MQLCGSVLINREPTRTVLCSRSHLLLYIYIYSLSFFSSFLTRSLSPADRTTSRLRPVSPLPALEGPVHLTLSRDVFLPEVFH